MKFVKLSHGKSVTRETLATSRYRPLIATLSEHSLALREKGMKGPAIRVSLVAIWELGCKLATREAFANGVRAGKKPKR